MDSFYHKTENGGSENKLVIKNKNLLNGNIYRKETEEKINRFKNEMNQFILSSQKFFEERENQDKKYNELTNYQGNEINKFNKTTQLEISKIRLYYKQKKNEAKKIYESKKKEFVKKVKSSFDKNYKEFTYSNNFLREKNELDKMMKNCMISSDSSQNQSYYTKMVPTNENNMFYKSPSHKKKYEELSQKLELLKAANKRIYDRQREKDFEKITDNLTGKYNELYKSLENEENSIIEKYEKQRELELDNIKKSHFIQLENLKKNFSEKKLILHNSYHNQLEALGFEQYMNKKEYEDEIKRYSNGGYFINGI